MTDQTPAIQLVNAVVAALEQFGRSVGSGEQPEPETVSAEPPRAADEHRLGRRQRQIVELPGLAEDEGMKTSEIATAIDYEVPNTYTALQALVRSQVVEQIPGREPQRWRLARRYRAASRAFASAVEQVHPGEWTTAGDVSIAVRGDRRAEQAVAGAVLSHRVLGDGTPASADLISRLEAEGVTFLEDGRPDPRQRVAWDELARRAATAVERRRRMARGTLNYIQVPARDQNESASFFEDVFGWKINRYPEVDVKADQTGYVGFVDPTGQVGGEFVLGREPSRNPGLLPSIAVASIDETLKEVTARGGEVLKPRTAIAPGKDYHAIFRDPAGNAFALYEEAGR